MLCRRTCLVNFVNMTELENEKNSDKWQHTKGATHSRDLLDVGRILNDDPLLIKKTKPYRMPQSSVLSDVKSFLPKMRDANCALEERLKTVPAEDLNIENISDCQQEVIEMNLALFAEESSSSDEGDNSSQSDDSSDSDSEILSSFQDVTAANLKLPNEPRKCRRTIIEDLSETGSEFKEEEVTLEGRNEENVFPNSQKRCEEKKNKSR